eukprot:8721746-Pyramimonas_sp.AAC.1
MAAPAACEEAPQRISFQASRCWVGATDRRPVLIASVPQPRGASKWHELARLLIDDDHAPRAAP